jgi:tellurium resistance protein TerZ
MSSYNHALLNAAEHVDARPDLKEVVMGLHWDPVERNAVSHQADLDALCVLFDAQGRVSEVVHPGHARSADSSVIHTGDSRDGASSWDDERIFVFLAALPEAVAHLAFVVSSAAGHPFNEIAGAYCHISDRVSETAWARIDLTALAGRTDHIVATICRGDGGWTLNTDMLGTEDRFLAELRLQLQYTKGG